MPNKTLPILAFIALLFFVSSTKAQDERNQTIPTLSYSELIKNKEKYFGKIVRVKALWIYGFESGIFCNLRCKADEVQVSVYFARDHDLCEGSKEKLKRVNKLDGKAEVVFVGTFFAGSLGFRPGMYAYQFEVSCVEKINKLLKFEKSPIDTRNEQPRTKQNYFLDGRRQ